MRRILLLAGAMLMSATAAVGQERPTVKIASGAVQGASEPGVQVFRGIPYAAPPVGDLRWRPPAPVAAWSGTRDASRYGAACMQPSDKQHESWARVGATSEDCLFLNVWRPERPGTYPVMVFLHGGGFTYGAAGVPLYDGAKLARRGVVVVTMNYRLGLLGHFAHPALLAESGGTPVGNYGIMDQIASLRWVHENVAQFGGDPGNVTLFGESAGAGVTQLLMVTPSARGLFHKAISQSGAGGTVLPPLRGGPASAEGLSLRLAEAAGLKNVTAAQLRALPAKLLGTRSAPFIDGTIAVASPGTPFARGREVMIPLLIGANSNEATLSANSEKGTRAVLGDRYDAFLRDYAAAMPGKSADVAKIELAEDALSLLPSMSIAVMHARNGAPAWSYYFDQVPGNKRAKSAGTPHGGEMEYVFGNPDEGSTWDAQDQAASDRMRVTGCSSRGPVIPM